MLRKWLIAGAAGLALAWAGVSPSFGAPCTPTTVPNTSGTTQNSVLELLESICSNASAVSVAGFSPSAANARGTPVAVTTSDSSGTLPTGTTVVVSNAGTTNPMYCNVNGVAATTSDQYIAPSGGWFSFTIPAAITTLHCIATGGSTTANMVGGAGLASGTGGGSGGGGGGVVTIANGADVTLGNNTDAPSCASGASLIACLRQANLGIAAALTTQGVQNPIGGVGIVPSANSGTAGTTVPCGSAVSTCQLKNGAGNLYSAYSRSGTAGWLMIFNATAAPTNGSTTAGIASTNMQDCVPAVQAQTGEYVASINYSPGPVEAFANGIYAAYSSTSCGTLTLSATAFLHGLIQ